MIDRLAQDAVSETKVRHEAAVDPRRYFESAGERRGEQACGLAQQRGRQRRAVRIEDDGAVVPAGEYLVDRDEQAVAEIGMPRLDQPDRRRQCRLEEGIRSGRPESHVAADRHVAPGRRDIGGDVAQERRVERGRFVESERRDQAGLGFSRDRRLGHHGDAAGRRPIPRQCDAHDRGILVSGRMAAGQPPIRHLGKILYANRRRGGSNFVVRRGSGR